MRAPAMPSLPALGRVIALFGLLLGSAAPAVAGLTNAAGSTAGSTCTGAISSAGFCGFTQQFLTNDGTTIRSRYAWNINADVGVGSSRTTDGTAVHQVSFDAVAPGGYRLDVTTQVIGGLAIYDDTPTIGSCDGNASTTSYTGSANPDVNSGTLNHGAPPSLGSENAGKLSPTPVGIGSSRTATIYGVSNGVAKPHTLSMTWSGHVRSASCEVSVRMGLQNGSTTGCGVCGYPGDPDRDLETDGQYIQVTFTSLCGNGTVDSQVGESCDDGAANGTVASDCTTTCQSACGNGIVNAGEACDDGAANGTNTSCCSASCQPRPAGSICRASAGPCDLTDTCNGVGTTCAIDFRAVGICREASGPCDVAEECGGGVNCPADGLRPSGFTCRAAAGTCDVAETCTGSSAACPANVLRASGFVCRGASGTCDVAESCSGSSGSCPNDGFVAQGTVCRTASDACDRIESCTGVTGDCPFDFRKFDGESCDDGVFCNGADTCASNSCSQHAGDPCVAANGDGCAESCNEFAETCDLPDPAGSACPDDGNPCTTDACSGPTNEAWVGFTGASGPFDSLQEILSWQVAGTPIQFVDFSGRAGLADFLGTAHNDDGTLRLTTDGLGSQSGATWWAEPVSVQPALDTTFGYRITGSGTHGHGFAFVIQHSPQGNQAYTEEADDSLGFAGIPNSLAVEFDIVQNPGEPAVPFVSVQSRGSLANTSEHTASLGSVSYPSITDGQAHTARVLFSAGTLSVYLDGAETPNLSVPIDLAALDLGAGTCEHAAGNASVTCREAAGECDVAESCDGASLECPGDVYEDPGVACTDDGNPCTLDSCEGSGPACAHPAGNAGATCRAAGGECDIEDVCNGSDTTCPDATQGAGTPCTEDGNPCTVDECDGGSAVCQHPAGNAGTPCREAGGVCDVAETCDGSSTACPADVKRGAGIACASDGNPCTLDQCDGSSTACQHPAGNAGTSCRAAAGVCDVDETCNGSSATCPADAKRTVGTTCRAASGLCDVAETCTGDSASCPVDAVHPEGTACRAASDTCDVAEACDGSSKTCPADQVQPDGTACDAESQCTSGDACLEGVCTPGPIEPGVCHDNFLCDRVTSSPGFTRVTNLSLTDAFESGLFDLVRPVQLCTPAAVANEVTIEPDSNLVRYQLKPSEGQAPHTRQTAVLVTNQLGSLSLDTVRADSLLVPAAMSLVPEPGEPAQGNRYKCYRVKVTPRTARFQRNVQLQLTDSFTDPAKLFDVRAPVHLCRAIDSTAPAEPSANLVCYRVRPASGEPKHSSQGPLYVADASASLVLNTINEYELCLPSAIGP